MILAIEASVVAILAFAADGVQPAMVCDVLIERSDGWSVGGKGQATGEGQIVAAVLTVYPPNVSVPPTPSKRRAPSLIFVSEVSFKNGRKAEAFRKVQINALKYRSDAVGDWNAQLLADNIEISAGSIGWDEEILLSDFHEKGVTVGHLVIERPSSTLLNSIDQAKTISAAVHSPGGGSWTVNYGKIKLSTIRSVRDEALGAMQQAAVKKGDAYTRGSSSCRSPQARLLTLPVLPIAPVKDKP